MSLGAANIDVTMWQHRPQINEVSELAREMGLTEPAHIQYLDAGLSNFNYKLTYQDGDYLLKCYRNGLKAKSLALQKKLADANISNAVIDYNLDKQVAIFKYIDGSHINTYDLLTNHKIDQLTQLLTQLHAFNENGEVMNLSDEVASYKTLTIYSDLEPKLQDKLAAIARFPNHHGFCHNDLLQSNIIETQQGVRLIDFEYSKVNDVFFDLASLCHSLELSQLQSAYMLDVYCELNGINMTRMSATNKLTNYLYVYRALCCFWYYEKGFYSQYSALNELLKAD